MANKYFKKYLPSHDDVQSSRLMRIFGRGLHNHNLWRLHRRSVAGGVAVGLFTGLVPGPFQVVFSALFALIFRVNLPVAVITTFYTNPFTIVPLYILAYKIGGIFVGQSVVSTEQHSIAFLDLKVSQWIPAFIDWAASMGKPLAVGLPILASSLAISGYILVRVIWRLQAVYRWRQRFSVKNK